VGLKSNGTHQLLINVDGVNLLADSVVAIKKNTLILVLASKKAG
jgi:hypothetical protein